MSREIKFRMVYQTTDEIIGYTDACRLLRNGDDVLPDYEKAILYGVLNDTEVIGTIHENPELLEGER